MRPLHTQGTENRFGLVAAFLAKHYGGKMTPGSAANEPIHTITAKDHHHLATVSLVNTANSKTTGRGPNTWSATEPLRTITSAPGFALATSQLAKLYNTTTGQDAREPLSQARVCTIIDEAHHMGPRCLNLVKSLINQTPGEFILLAMPQLWARLGHKAYEEIRQLSGNRLAERIALEVREKDIKRYVDQRVPAFEQMDKAEQQAVITALITKARAPRMGNLAYVRGVCKRLAGRTEVTLEDWSGACAEETAKRGGKINA